MTWNSCRQAMTLIELLIVTFILAAMATSVVAVTDSIDQAQRQRQTYETLAAIRTASSGPGPSAERLGIGGFIQDLGRLPEDGSVLLVNPNPLFTYGYDPAWRVWSGWRGPYLVPPTLRTGESATTARLYDGWGQDFTWAIATNVLTVSSSNLTAPPQPLIVENTWTKNISDILIQFKSRSLPLPSVTLAPSLSLRLRIVHPPIATIDPDPDGDGHSSDQTFSGLVLPGAWSPIINVDDEDYKAGYRFRTIPSGIKFGEGEPTARRIAIGRRAMIVVTEDGDPLDPDTSPNASSEQLFLVSEPDTNKPLVFDCGILP